MRENSSLYSLNRGVVSRLGLARADIKRLAMAAEDQTNWMARVLGPMSLRPGLGYIGTSRSNLAARYLPFIFATSDLALLELSDSFMRVWINDVLLTRPAVSTAIVNGTFPTDLSSWTDMDDSGGASTWEAPNYMRLLGNGTARAMREQHVTNASPNIEHGIRIVVHRGPVMLRIGSTSGGDDYVSETTLNTGTHSLSIVPSGDFYIRFFSLKAYSVFVSNCTIEAAGVVTVPTPWAAGNLSNIRFDQSADVLFVACTGKQQRRIERRGTRPNARSWSVVSYLPEDGPFQVQNTGPITIAASAISGDITLTASLPLFKSSHAGALFSLTSVGQIVNATAAASSTATSSIRVIGVGTSRIFAIDIVGDGSASTVDLQRSFDDASWANVAGQTWVADTYTSFSDGLDNQIVYYRLILTTRVAPDSVFMQLRIGSGSARGVVRITAVGSSVSASAQVLSSLGGVVATDVWQEGQWSDLLGWPTAVRIHGGRLWWAGLNGIWGSISDAYDSFDEEFLGDAGPINRTIGSGPVDVVNWILSLKGLILGPQGAEYAIRASSLDEPLTPTNFNPSVSSTQGSAAVEAIKVDQSGYFVNRSSTKVFDISFDIRSDYSAANLMELAPEIGLPGIVRIDCQRNPDTRLHCVKSDGTVIVCVIDKNEEVMCWIPVETDGFIEDVVVLPAITGDLDDQVYYLVRRTINSSTVRYLEKWAQEIDCRGDQSLCLLADSYVTYTGLPTVTVPVAHLEGEEVVVWADGADVGTDEDTYPWTQRYTVSGGVITLDDAASNVVVGLGYTAQFKSAKLGSQTQAGSPLNRTKSVGHIGLVLADTHKKGVRFGPSFDVLDNMPEIEAGTDVTDEVSADYDQEVIAFPGTWTTNARVCIQGQAPRPATVVAITPDLTVN